MRAAASTRRHRASAGQALTHAQARAFYDRFVVLQEWQRWYEASALDLLVRQAEFGGARAVLELGCGTGWLAERLLGSELASGARYLALDVSPRMARRTRTRLARFGPRVEVRVTDGSPGLAAPDGGFDRFVAAYVLDLLSEADLQLAVDEAYRVLEPGGRLCTACLTAGTTRASRALCRAWEAVHRLDPRLVGGCRPVDVRAALTSARWEILSCETVVQLSVPTQVLVARRRRAARSRHPSRV